MYEVNIKEMNFELTNVRTIKLKQINEIRNFILETNFLLR